MTGEFTTEQAAELLLQERQERAERVKEKLQKLLDEERCMIRPYAFLDEEGRTKAAVEIVAL